MPLRLKRKGETREVTLAGAEGQAPTVFTVALLGHKELLRLRSEHTERGAVDEQELDRALWARTVVGWKGLFDEDGKDEIPFSAELALKLYDEDRFAPDVVHLIAMTARLPSTRHHDALGNSNGS